MNMGLDNIPYEYPCIAEGLQAEDESIDCNSNIDNNKCPWHREMVNAGMATYGMMGTPCWFRGKVGNFMLQELEEAGYKTPLTDIGDNISFYGDTYGEDEMLSPEGCLKLAEWMSKHAEAYAATLFKADSFAPKDYGYGVERITEEYRYAINWLKFVAPYGGSKVWY
jgi:hypothetical protein